MTSTTTRDLITSAALYGFTASGRSTAARKGIKETGQRAEIDEMQILDVLNAPVETAALDQPATEEDQAAPAA